MVSQVVIAILRAVSESTATAHDQQFAILRMHPKAQANPQAKRVLPFLRR